MSTTLDRYLVYRTRTARHSLCIIAARSAKKALKTARQMFTLTREARAVLETPAQRQAAAIAAGFRPS